MSLPSLVVFLILKKTSWWFASTTLICAVAGQRSALGTDGARVGSRRRWGTDVDVLGLSWRFSVRHAGSECKESYRGANRADSSGAMEERGEREREGKEGERKEGEQLGRSKFATRLDCAAQALHFVAPKGSTRRAPIEQGQEVNLLLPMPLPRRYRRWRLETHPWWRQRRHEPGPGGTLGEKRRWGRAGAKGGHARRWRTEVGGRRLTLLSGREGGSRQGGDPGVWRVETGRAEAGHRLETGLDRRARTGVASHGRERGHAEAGHLRRRDHVMRRGRTPKPGWWGRTGRKARHRALDRGRDRRRGAKRRRGLPHEVHLAALPLLRWGRLLARRSCRRRGKGEAGRRLGGEDAEAVAAARRVRAEDGAVDRRLRLGVSASQTRRRSGKGRVRRRGQVLLQAESRRLRPQEGRVAGRSWFGGNRRLTDAWVSPHLRAMNRGDGPLSSSEAC